MTSSGPGHVDPSGRTRRHLWPLLLLGGVLGMFAAGTRFDLPVLAWLYLPFVIAWTRSVRRWWVAALGATGLTLCWVTFWLVAAGLTEPLLFVLGLAYVPATALPLLLDRLTARRLPGALAALVYPSARVAAEFLIVATMPLGTIYGVLGSTQAGAGPLVQLASVTGVYGVSFLMAWGGALGATWLTSPRMPLRDRRLARLTVVYLLVLAVVAGAGWWRIASYQPGETVRVAAIAPSEESWAAAVDMPPVPLQDVGREVGAEGLRRYYGPSVDDLVRKTQATAEDGAVLVAWSEVGASVHASDLPGLVDRVRDVSAETGVTVAMAVAVYRDEPPWFQNRSVLVRPDGSLGWTFDKARPIPVLEPYAAGPGVVPVVDTPIGRLSTVICYDADFPGLVRQASDADLLLIPTNDWPEIAQMHADSAAFRAVETGTTVIRPASGGITLINDPVGRRTGQADDATRSETTLVGVASTTGLTTVYGVVGDAFAWLCCLAVLGSTLLVLVKIRRRPPGGSVDGGGPVDQPEPTGGRPDVAEDGERTAPHRM